MSDAPWSWVFEDTLKLTAVGFESGMKRGCFEAGMRVDDTWDAR